MATKVKPCRIQATGTPQVGNVPVYVDEDTFQWGAGGGGGSGDVTGPNSSTDGDVALFDGATGKIIKDSGVNLSSKLDASALSDTNYGGAWNGDTTHTATKNAIYTKLHTMDVEIGNKAADNTVVKLSGNQTIAGTKTFSTSPVVPSKTTDATNTGTAIATEAQVYKKAEIAYVTSAEYTALLPGAESDGKHYFIYTPSVVPPTPASRPTITGFTYDSKTGAVAQSTYGDCNAITFKPDGTKVYIAGETNNTVYQFSLATPRDITTISYDNKSKSVIGQTSNVAEAIIFADNGSTMYIGGGWGTGRLFKYTLSTAWDVSTASYDNVQSNITFTDCSSYKIYNEGNYVYVINRSNGTLYRYTMTIAWDITTIDSGSQQSLQLPDLGVGDYGYYHEVVLNPDGTQMFGLSRRKQAVAIFSLSTAWDITTATLDDTYLIPTPNSANITSMAIDNDGLNMYLGGLQLNNIYQYSTTTA